MLTPDQQTVLLDLARNSIAHGLDYDAPLWVDAAAYDEALRERRGVFVTLKLDDQLRGCIGTTQPAGPIVEGVSKFAFYAAFRDSRFPQLGRHEFPGLWVQVSILSLQVPISFVSESNLIAQLQPGVDGLVLEDSGRQGTFLPSVWEMLPDPWDFWRQLKRKAGLPMDHWSDTLQVSRYTSYCFHSHAG